MNPNPATFKITFPITDSMMGEIERLARLQNIPIEAAAREALLSGLRATSRRVARERKAERKRIRRERYQQRRRGGGDGGGNPNSGSGGGGKRKRERRPAPITLETLPTP